MEMKKMAVSAPVFAQDLHRPIDCDGAYDVDFGNVAIANRRRVAFVVPFLAPDPDDVLQAKRKLHRLPRSLMEQFRKAARSRTSCHDLPFPWASEAAMPIAQCWLAVRKLKIS
jgi:hypothetical protein